MSVNSQEEATICIENANQRVVIEGVSPQIDGGCYPIKRVVGEKVRVEADIFAEGHDVLTAVVLYKKTEDIHWSEVPMEPLANDRWRGEFTVNGLGCQYLYTVKAWVDSFVTWRQGIAKKAEAGQDVAVELLIGAQLVKEAGLRAKGTDARHLQSLAKYLASDLDQEDRLQTALGEELCYLMSKYPDNSDATVYPKELRVIVEREKARFSTWYEMFPRSYGAKPGQHGTFADCEARLSYVAAMGFDVLYLPPIHPIGHTHRKGKNNTPTAKLGDVGSPWAIGSEEGGHKAVHPQLGTLKDFRRFVSKAKGHGLEVALDLAYQCSPDHPYVKQHPEWFHWRPDKTVQYAENPPKKYEDIYPFNFDTKQWRELWEELKSIVLFWIEQGVRIFRVDNPHTKPFAFWEWLLAEIKRDHPDVIFLSEAFTRPKIMYKLAKIGFTQSYTYFAWRNTKWDLTQYFTELTKTEVAEYFRPNLWPNTPDILTEYLQTGGRPAFMARLVLAATLGASYGIYGPVFELNENQPREPGSEEYLNSEKYELRHWSDRPVDSFPEFIGRVNHIRRENRALQSNHSLSFHHVDNDYIICYSKHTDDLDNIVLIAVNFDPRYTQAGWVEVPLAKFGLDPDEPYEVHDLLSDARYTWQGARNYIELNPHVVPAHIFLVRRRSEAQRDFEEPR